MISDSSESIMAAHRTLQFLLTKAAISGKVHKTSLRIPFSDLAASVGQQKSADYDLIVTFNLSWDEHKVEEEILEESENE